MTDRESPGGPLGRTIGGYDSGSRLWVLAIFAVGGLALGAVLPALANWAADLPWVPFQGPIELLGSFDQPWLAVCDAFVGNGYPWEGARD